MPDGLPLKIRTRYPLLKISLAQFDLSLRKKNYIFKRKLEKIKLLKIINSREGDIRNEEKKQ